jgi:hypothetical protein
MLRLIGFFFGIAMALVLLATVVDAPTRERAGALVQRSFRGLLEGVAPMEAERGAGPATRDAAIEQGRQPGRVEPPVVADPPLRFAAPASWPEPPIAEAPMPAADTASGRVASTPVTEPPIALPQGESPALKEVSDPLERQPGWQPLWQAFRSELSAKGFAGQLQRLTGQRYRVRRTSPWAYQVELAYDDARQRDAVLQEIARKTGLGLGEARP